MSDFERAPVLSMLRGLSLADTIGDVWDEITAFAQTTGLGKVDWCWKHDHYVLSWDMPDPDDFDEPCEVDDD